MKTKPSNEMLAKYIVENYGHDVSDDILKKIAKLYNMRPNVLIKNYRSWSNLIRIFEQAK